MIYLSWFIKNILWRLINTLLTFLMSSFSVLLFVPIAPFIFSYRAFRDNNCFGDEDFDMSMVDE